MASRLERPRFFEGQYIGSADLEAVITYARDTAREHALGAHSWGIATGLELVESVSEGGGVDYFVLPGLGWDGYGRPLLLLEPKQIPAARFAGLTSGDQTVWLRYNEAPFQALRPGFETCSAEQSYSRVRESVEVEVGSFGLSDREGGIEVAGIAVGDARLAPRLFQDSAVDSAENGAPILCDGAVPHQTFPSDSERWLVPIGVATWQNGVPGLLQSRSDESLKLSRAQRRMAGAVAESLFAADGIIRLRDRYQPFQSGAPLDGLCAPVQTGDLAKALDSAGKETSRLVGKELVWVEGNLRVTGQARLFGTRLELLDSAGAETDGTPLYARRGVSANNKAGGQDFQIVIGMESAGRNRFAVGPAGADYGAITERFVVGSNGVVAFGDAIPADLLTNSGLVAARAGATFALAADPAKTSRLSFQSLPMLTELAHVGFDDSTKRLRAGVGADLTRYTYWTDSGRVGIGIDQPVCALHVAQAVPTVRIEANGGDSKLELVSGTDTSLTHVAGSGQAVLRNGGVQSMTWYQGQVGINLGFGNPTTNLHVQGNRTSSPGSPWNHVALIENLGGANADVLALRVGGAQSSLNNNFITFFDSTGTIGRIEKSTTQAPDNPKEAGTFLRLLSGGADFAECLPRPVGAQAIGAGRIVGVRRGEVSLKTDEADSLMITTDRAVVVGNAAGGVESGETIALIGQVWARVDGPVESGDFILPSGRNDGTGRAVAPDRLLPAEAPQVVGRAWSDSPGPASAQVKVAVGMQGADALSALSRALANQQRTIAALEEAVAAAALRGGG